MKENTEAKKDDNTANVQAVGCETPGYDHNYIYLIDVGDIAAEHVWSADPDPDGNTDDRDVLEYVRSDWYEDAMEECDELRLTLAMVQSRIEQVTKQWQMETGKKSILPDLGALIEWGLNKA